MEYSVRFEDKQNELVEADTVTFKEGGAVAFWNTSDVLTTDSHNELVRAFRDWDEVEPL